MMMTSEKDPRNPPGARGFLRAEEGAATLEAMLWIPFMFLLTIAMADTFLVYMSHASAAMVLENGMRNLVVGLLADCDALETAIEASLAANIPSVQATCIPYGGQTGIQVTMPAAEMGIGAISGFLDNFTLSASALRTQEVVSAAPAPGPAP